MEEGMEVYIWNFRKFLNRPLLFWIHDVPRKLLQVEMMD